MMSTQKKLRYIYNPAQAQFYIDNGLKVIQKGTNGKTGKTFWVFLNGVAQTALFKEWMNKKQ